MCEKKIDELMAVYQSFTLKFLNDFGCLANRFLYSFYPNISTGSKHLRVHKPLEVDNKIIAFKGNHKETHSNTLTQPYYLINLTPQICRDRET